MIVLTYIKLHQSAMRDIVLLVDHAIKKTNRRTRAASLSCRKWSCSVGPDGAPDFKVVVRVQSPL